jgi:hypothetical protein
LILLTCITHKNSHHAFSFLGSTVEKAWLNLLGQGNQWLSFINFLQVALFVHALFAFLHPCIAFFLKDSNSILKMPFTASNTTISDFLPSFYAILCTYLFCRHSPKRLIPPIFFNNWDIKPTFFYYSKFLNSIPFTLVFQSCVIQRIEA